MPSNVTNTAHSIILTGQIPYSQEAEEAVIGAVIVNPEAFIGVAAFLTPDDFFITRHSYIWDAMLRIHDRREPMDYLTLQEELRGMGRLTECGGPAYLTQLMNSMPTSMHAEIYGRIVERASSRRRYLAFFEGARQLTMDEEIPLEKLQADLEKAWMLARQRNGVEQERSFRDIMSNFYDEVEFRMRNPGAMTGIPTGLRDLDDLLGGMKKSNLLVIGGRPSMGKSALMGTMAYNQAQLGLRVGIMSLEMTEDELAARFSSMDLSTNQKRLTEGSISLNEFARFTNSVGKLASWPMHIWDKRSMTMPMLEAKAHEWAWRTGLDVLYVDYLQVIARAGASREETRANEVGTFAEGLKTIARELNIPVCALAQLNRDLEKRQDKRPVMADLRESGGIEQAADILMFLYRDVVYNEDTEFPNRADIIVAKHRNGPTGVVSTHFERSLTKFSDSRTQSIDLSGL